MCNKYSEIKYKNNHFMRKWIFVLEQFNYNSSK